MLIAVSLQMALYPCVFCCTCGCIGIQRTKKLTSVLSVITSAMHAIATTKTHTGKLNGQNYGGQSRFLLGVLDLGGWCGREKLPNVMCVELCPAHDCIIMCLDVIVACCYPSSDVFCGS